MLHIVRYQAPKTIQYVHGYMHVTINSKEVRFYQILLLRLSFGFKPVWERRARLSGLHFKYPKYLRTYYIRNQRVVTGTHTIHPKEDDSCCCCNAAACFIASVCVSNLAVFLLACRSALGSERRYFRLPPLILFVVVLVSICGVCACGVLCCPHSFTVLTYVGLLGNEMRSNPPGITYLFLVEK